MQDSNKPYGKEFVLRHSAFLLNLQKFYACEIYLWTYNFISR